MVLADSSMQSSFPAPDPAFIARSRWTGVWVPASASSIATHRPIAARSAAASAGSPNRARSPSNSASPSEIVSRTRPPNPCWIGRTTGVGAGRIGPVSTAIRPLHPASDSTVALTTQHTDRINQTEQFVSRTCSPGTPPHLRDRSIERIHPAPHPNPADTCQTPQPLQRPPHAPTVRPRSQISDPPATGLIRSRMNSATTSSEPWSGGTRSSPASSATTTP